MKKCFALLICCCMLFSSASAADNIAYESESANARLCNEKIDAVETAVNALDLTATAENKSSSEVQNELHEILAQNGFVELDADSEGEPAPFSDSNAVKFQNEGLYYDSSTGLYRYTCEVKWQGVWDSLSGLEDFAAVRMTRPENYYIYSSFAATWDNRGNQTGYVAADGNHTPSSSYVTKRFEDTIGVCFNVIDDYLYDSPSFTTTYYTDKVRLTVYIKLRPGASADSANKLFMDYHHNYKKLVTSFAGKLSSVGFTGISNELSVTYTTAPANWQRTSGGKTLSNAS